MRSTILIFAVITISSVCCQRENSLGPSVQTKSGKIRGHYLTSYKGNKYEAYQGIPYALPPIGERRFQSPLPVEPWTEELQATELKDHCMHDSPVQRDEPVSGSEDCLHLNVYVPTTKKTNSSLPVVFYLYGGAFRNGGINEAQEQYIIDYDVIFASANSRTGVLGFLSTEDELVPGNMGLKDQSTALRWLHDNIEQFGGDPKRITLFGGSSGAVSVQYHYLSSWSRGLFHAGISMSGTAFIPAAQAEHSRDKTIALGRLVNCTDNNVAQLVKCLRNVPGEALVDAQWRVKTIGNIPMAPLLFGPVVEKSSADPFITDSPIKLLRQGKAYDVPWVAGIVAQEGLAWTAGFTRNETLKDIDKNWDSLAPEMLEYQHKIPKEQHASVARKIREHYFGDKAINRETFRVLTDVIGHRTFSIGVVNAARVQAASNKSPVFLYYYKYRATDSHTNVLTNSTEDLGVAHGDDTLLVIGNKLIVPTKSARDRAMQKRLIEIITSVAYNGVPDIGVEWPRVSPNIMDSLDYLILAGPDDVKSGYSNDLDQTKFWNSIGLGGL